MTVCNELGIKYEIVTVDLMKGAHKDPDYINTKQPFGAVPVLVVSAPPSRLSQLS
jgi:glutathione S-transferase